MTKVVLLTEFYPPDIGGIQSSVEPIATALGKDVTLVAPQVTTADRTIRRSLFSGTGWPRWWWLMSWLRKARRDGMELALFGHFSAAVLAAAITGVPFAVLVHGNDLLFEERRRLMKPFIGWVIRRAQWIGVNSAFTRTNIHSYGVPLVKIIDTHPFVPIIRVTKNEKQKSSSHRLITVARLVKRKNISMVLEVLARIRQKFPDCTLDCVGEGPERNNLEQQTRALGIEGAVIFHGAVSDEEKWKLFGQADVFVMVPTVERSGSDVEGFGLVYCEAAAVGLPVVGSDTGGVRDAVVNGETGILVDPNDTDAVVTALSSLFDDQEKAHKMGEHGRQRVLREYTDEIRVSRVQQMIQPQQTKLVSIIIPAYQAATTIAATLHSMQAQTYKNVEVIVVDDGSTDNIASVLKPFGFVKLIRQENAGAPKARNVGFNHSRGEYCLFLDADIVLEPTAIAKMVQALDVHSNVDMVYSDFIFGWKRFHLHEYSVEALKKMNYIHTSSLIRRSAFTRFDENLKRFQDWDLWLTMAEQGHQALWIPEMLFTVTQRDRKLGMSTWLPSFVYKLPFIGQGKGNATVAKYREAERVVREKHRL